MAVQILKQFTNHFKTH